MSRHEIVLYIDRILNLANSRFLLRYSNFCDALDINYGNYTISSNKMKLPKYQRYREIIFRACYNEKVCVI